ncbi:hypothetical protein Patl1_16334 [Pistacia atlantica]|uniref:Uncharacterized protein n=1 Tax=Pistacia atlantica TaxID=434234 RepID=A0ACC1B9V4_9ROSI|nr:hypothetical protein Patl1_16334 [Pistacia atlantica]
MKLPGINDRLVIEIDHSIILFSPIFYAKLPGKWSFACGFQCSSYPDCYTGSTYLFGIFAVDETGGAVKLVWSSNRNKPVRNNTNLLLTRDGDLMLQEFDGTLVWSTNTKGKSVAGLKLTESGNLVLFDTNNSIVWQSFDYPTDTLLIGQKLYSNSGQELTASTSPTNYSEGGSYSLSLTNKGLSAFIESDPSLVYSKYTGIGGEENTRQPHYAILLNGSFAGFTKGSNSSQWVISSSQWDISILHSKTPLQHVSLDYDGHLRAYDIVDSKWQSVTDIFNMDSCDYPLVCGRYGICLKSSKDDTALCSCPQPDDTKPSYFRPTSDRHPNLGCSEVNSLSCDKFKYQKMVELKNVSHLKGLVYIKNTDVKSCKLDCLRNCSCKAAMLDSSRNCYLESQIFSLKDVEPDREIDPIRFFLKVQDDSRVSKFPSISASTHIKGKTRQRVIILGWSLGVLSGLLLIIGIIYIAFSGNKKDGDDLEEEYLEEVPGMPKRYSYEDLITTTDNFSKKLGQGGFGSVFEGTLNDGTMVAVKCLEGLGQIKESFLSEVKTIGSIHHVNLVRLIGYSTNRASVIPGPKNGAADVATPMLPSTLSGPSQSVDLSGMQFLRRLSIQALSLLVYGKWSFACGFQCSSYPDCNTGLTYLFGIFVWSSNRNKPVRSNVTLLLTRDGDLVLQDFDGTLVWSNSTKGKCVAGLKLTELGNLVLFDTNNSTVWESFGHPCDT